MYDAKYVCLMVNTCLNQGPQKELSELLEEKAPVVCAFLLFWETTSAKYYFGFI